MSAPATETALQVARCDGKLPPARSLPRRRTQTADQERNRRRSPDVVPRLRRFLRAGALFQADRDAASCGRRRSPPSPASAARAASRISSRRYGAHYIHGRSLAFASGRFAVPARPARVRVWRRRRPVLHRRQSLHPHGAQEHQADLRRHGQLGLRPDQETDLAHLTARVQEQDRHLGRGGLSHQPDEAGHRRRRHLRGPHHPLQSRTTSCR